MILNFVFITFKWTIYYFNLLRLSIRMWQSEVSSVVCLLVCAAKCTFPFCSPNTSGCCRIDSSVDRKMKSWFSAHCFITLYFFLAGEGYQAIPNQKAKVQVKSRVTGIKVKFLRGIKKSRGCRNKILFTLFLLFMCCFSMKPYVSYCNFQSWQCLSPSEMEHCS